MISEDPTDADAKALLAELPERTPADEIRDAFRRTIRLLTNPSKAMLDAVRDAARELEAALAKR